MILELDCGNTLIKWRLVDQSGVRTGLAADEEAMLAALGQQKTVSLRGARLVSVRSQEETDAIAAALERAFGLPCQVAQPARELGGVRNGYDDFHTLGMDRWLAVVGAYFLAHKACLVIDIGTAITADFVRQDGVHLGGFICPGLPLMHRELKSHTRRIRFPDGEMVASPPGDEPGRKTSDAVERGCLWMVRGFVQEQIKLAGRLLGPEHEVYVTGGDAHLVGDLKGCRFAPDLVFTGLAIACPIG